MSDSPSKDSSAPWHRNSTIMAALITGVFGFIGTVVTLVISRPAVEPHDSRAHQNEPRSSSSNFSDAIVSIPVEANQHRSPSSSMASQQELRFKLRQNFVAFQALATNTRLTDQERSELANTVINQTVVWKGYVDSITRMDSPTEDAAISVSLVENSEKQYQSMFKTPAIFRLGKDEQKLVDSLSIGDLVMISGTVTNHSLIGTIVERSHILEPNQQPVNRLSTVPARSNER